LGAISPVVYPLGSVIARAQGARRPPHWAANGPSVRQFIPGAAFRLNTSAERLRLFRIQLMPTAKRHALTIIRAFDEAQSELVGKAVVLSDGKAGTVEKVWLDEAHGLRISIRGHDGKWPVSTIKFTQS